MTAASGAAHGLLLRHAATSDGQLALPVDPAAIARAEGVDMPPVQNAYGRWEAAVALGRAPNLAIGRLVYRERHWMEEDL